MTASKSCRGAVLAPIGCKFCSEITHAVEVVEYCGITIEINTCWFCGRKLEGER